MSQMKLGWWRDRDGVEHKVERCVRNGRFPYTSIDETWTESGSYTGLPMRHRRDLIEFIRPLEDLPPALNSAVKAAEDRVRRMESQYHAAQKVANDACDNMNHARRELERLERECEWSK